VVRPRTYSIDPVNRTVWVRFRGRLALADIATYAASLRVDPRFDPSYSEIVDVRRVKDFDLTADDAVILADKVDPFAMGCNRAFIAATQVQVNSIKMHVLLRNDDEHTRIFSTIKEAQEWIASAR